MGGSYLYNYLSFGGGVYSQGVGVNGKYIVRFGVYSQVPHVIRENSTNRENESTVLAKFAIKDKL